VREPKKITKGENEKEEQKEGKRQRLCFFSWFFLVLAQRAMCLWVAAGHIALLFFVKTEKKGRKERKRKGGNTGVCVTNRGVVCVASFFCCC